MIRVFWLFSYLSLVPHPIQIPLCTQRDEIQMDKSSGWVYRETRFSHNHTVRIPVDMPNTAPPLSWLNLTALSCRQIPQTEIGHRKSNEGE